MVAANVRIGSMFGKYKLNRLLGQGGMGEVYEAYDTSKDRTVALKILRQELSNDERFRSRFQRESRAAAMLEEPHVIPIYDWGETDGSLFIDMRLVRGQDLHELLKRGHGGSPVSKPLNKCTIADYVDDVRSVAATLTATPVLIGHSMGGFIVQKYLETGKAPAAVLVSSAPPRSWFRTSLWSARKHPWLAAKVGMTRKFLSVYPTPAHIREVLFCAHTPEPIVAQCFARAPGGEFTSARVGYVPVEPGSTPAHNDADAGPRRCRHRVGPATG